MFPASKIVDAIRFAALSTVSRLVPDCSAANFNSPRASTLNPVRLRHLVEFVAQGHESLDASYGKAGQCYACAYGKALGSRPDALEDLPRARP